MADTLRHLITEQGRIRTSQRSHERTLSVGAGEYDMRRARGRAQTLAGTLTQHRIKVNVGIEEASSLTKFTLELTVMERAHMVAFNESLDGGTQPETTSKWVLEDDDNTARRTEFEKASSPLSRLVAERHACLIFRRQMR